MEIVDEISFGSMGARLPETSRWRRVLLLLLLLSLLLELPLVPLGLNV